jgi:hypothetical protein
MCPDIKRHPLCHFFLSGYISKKPADLENFPTDQFPAAFDRYEKLFGSALNVLGLSRQALKKKAQFNFDSGNAANLKGGVAILRVVEALFIKRFSNVIMVELTQESKNVGIVAEKDNQKVCFEIRTITKQSGDQKESFRVGLRSARRQLERMTEQLHCTVKILVCVVNWFERFTYIGQDSLQYMLNKLQPDGLDGIEAQESLKGVDGVWFVMNMGHRFLVLNEPGKLVAR